MKKILLLAAVSLMVFTSCTNDEQDYSLANKQRQQITFATPVMHGISRVAGEMSNPYDKKEFFVVFGAKTLDGSYGGHDNWPYMDVISCAFNFGADSLTNFKGVVVKHSNGAGGWITEHPYYFEEPFTYDFAAYSPARILASNQYGVHAIPADTEGSDSKAASAAISESNGMVITGYEPGTLGKQVDLMYARTKGIKGSGDFNKNETGQPGQVHNGNDYYNGVNLTFHHALSSIHFQIGFKKEFQQLMEEAGYETYMDKFKIKSITLKNIVKKGDFTELPSENDPNWVLDKTAANCTATDYTFYNNTGGYVLYKHISQGNATGHIKLGELIDLKDLTESASTYGLKGTGLLIPQDLLEVTDGLGTSTNKPEAEIVIVWQRPTDVDINDGANDGVEEVTTTINATASTITKWEMGKRYTYKLLFSRDIIYFAPEVSDWTVNKGNDTDGNENPESLIEIPVK